MGDKNGKNGKDRDEDNQVVQDSVTGNLVNEEPWSKDDEDK